MKEKGKPSGNMEGEDVGASSVATKEEAPTVYVSKVVDGKTIHEVASKEWLDAYTKRINAPINID